MLPLGCDVEQSMRWGALAAVATLWLPLPPHARSCTLCPVTLIALEAREVHGHGSLGQAGEAFAPSGLN